MDKLILASKSPRRAAILRQIGVEFVSVESNYKEKVYKGITTASLVESLVIENAKGKALDVANKIGDGVVLGIDTLIFCKGQVVGKPKNKKNSLDILYLINGKMHKVFSGICLIKKDKKGMKILTGIGITKVYMRKAEDYEIESYVKTGEPLDKAGGYGIQERGAILIDRIDGDYYTVVGLPLSKFIELFKELKLNLIN